MEHANLPRPGHPHKLSHHAKRTIVNEATKTPMNILKEFKAWAHEIGETLHTTTVARFFTRALWESGKEKATVAESSLHICSPKGMRGIPRSTGRKFFGLMKQKFSFLAFRLDAMFGRNQTLNITLSPQWSMVVATSCCGDASQQQALESFVKVEDEMIAAKYRYNLIQSTGDL